MLTTLEEAESWLSFNGEMIQRRAWEEHDETAQQLVDIHGMMLDDPDESPTLRNLLHAIDTYRHLHGDLAKRKAMSVACPPI